jgi:hypothetical protein
MPDDQTAAGVRQLIANTKRKKKGSEKARRRRVEAIARWESWLPELERKEAAEAYEAKQRQIKENGERLRRETEQRTQQGQTPAEVEENLARIAGHPIALNQTEKKRVCFRVYTTGEYYFRGAYDALVPAKIKKLDNGSYVDAQDNEPVEIIDTFPPPTRGAVLLDNGDWKLPEVKHPVIAPPPPKRDPVMIGWQPHPEKVSAEKLAEKIRKLGYQATVGSTDNRVYVLYDERWIGVADWRAKMPIEL